MKGRLLQGSDNKQFALEEFFDSNRLKCHKCGCLLDPNFRSLRIDFKSKFDFSTTYDGVDIVSKSFKEYIQTEGYSNIIFYPVNERNDFFYFQILNSVIRVDIEKSGIQYHEKCAVCNYPEEIIGGVDIIVMSEEPLPDGFYTTDVYWRTHYLFGPQKIIGIGTAEKLKAQKFKGLYVLRKVF